MENYTLKNGILCFALLAMSGCSGISKYPGSSSPQKMSADTLCYRQAYAKSNEAYGEEIQARDLDCAKILEDTRLYDGERNMDPMTRR